MTLPQARTSLAPPKRVDRGRSCPRAGAPGSRAPVGARDVDRSCRRPSWERIRKTSATSDRRRPSPAPRSAPPSRAGAAQRRAARARRELERCPPPADAAGDLDQRRAEHQIAVVAREPDLGHHARSRTTTRRRKRPPPRRGHRAARDRWPGCQRRARHGWRVHNSPSSDHHGDRPPTDFDAQQHGRPGVVLELGAERTWANAGLFERGCWARLTPRSEVTRAPRTRAGTTAQG